MKEKPSWICVLRKDGTPFYTRTIMNKDNSLFFYDFLSKEKVQLDIIDLDAIFPSDREISK